MYHIMAIILHAMGHAHLHTHLHAMVIIAPHIVVGIKVAKLERQIKKHLKDANDCVDPTKYFHLIKYFI